MEACSAHPARLPNQYATDEMTATSAAVSSSTMADPLGSDWRFR